MAKTTPGFYVRGSILWIHLKVGNREIRKSTGLSAEANVNFNRVVTMVGNIREDLAKGIYVEDAYFPKSQAPAAKELRYLKGFAPYWLQTLSVEKSTYRAYKASAAYWVRKFGNKALDQITQGQIKIALNEKKKDKDSGVELDATKLGNKTKNNYMSALSVMYKAAIKEKLATDNPTQGIPKFKLVKGRNINPVEDKTLLAQILSKLTEKDIRVGAYFEFAVLTGLRPSELIALQWQDVNYLESSVNVCRARVEHSNKLTKSDKPRDVLLSTRALQILKVMEPFTKLKSQFIFEHPLTGEPWMSSDKQRKVYWHPVLKALGLPQGQKYHPYCLRHTRACDLIAQGMPLLFVAEQLGHENPSTTLAHYGKWLKSSNASVLEKLNAAEALALEKLKA